MDMTFHLLQEAIKDGDIDQVRANWSLDVVNKNRDDWGEPLLCRAIRYSQLEIIKFMLENGADPNVRYRSTNDWTPLMASMPNDIWWEARMLLCKHGANPFLKDSGGWDARGYYSFVKSNQLWCYLVVELVCGEADDLPVDLWRVVKPFLYTKE